MASRLYDLSKQLAMSKKRAVARHAYPLRRAPRPLRILRKKRKNKPKVGKRYADLRGCHSSLPNILRTSHVYTDYIDVDVANTASRTHIWRLNSLQDPDFSGAGARYVMSDDMYTYYGYSRVNNTKVTMTLFNKTTRAMRVFFIASPSTVLYNDPITYDLKGHPGFIKSYDIGQTGSDEGGVKMEFSVNIRKMFRKLQFPQTEQVTANFQGLWATYHADPPSALYLQVYLQALDESVIRNMTYDYAIDLRTDVTWATQNIAPSITYD